MGAAAMTVYTLEDLQSIEGVQPEVVKKRLRINCFSGTFVRDRDFPIRFRDEALKVLANYLDSGIKSFIVQSSLYLTLWKEEKQAEAVQSKSVASTTKVSKDISSPELTASSQKTIKKYRGQEYIVEPQPEVYNPTKIVGETPVGEGLEVNDATLASRRKIIKKYRGQEYIVEI